MKSLLASLAVVSSLVACANSKAPAAARAEPAAVRTFTSTRWTFATNSYFLEGPSGLVMIDTQFLPSVALQAADEAERATGKKLVAAVVLHANPDKFNGTTALQARGVRVLTSQQVAALIPAVHEKRLAAFGERYAPDYPTVAPKPDVFGDTTTTLSLAGLELRAHVLGAGASEAHVAIEWQGHLFVGDLVASGGHAWLEIGRPDAWLTRIGELRALGARVVHPGRGVSGGPELLDRHERYLRDVDTIVAGEDPRVPDDESGIERAKAKILAAYPKHEWAVFLELGLPAVWNHHVGAGK